jgi:hypothetical protein
MGALGLNSSNFNYLKEREAKKWDMGYGMGLKSRMQLDIRLLT